MMKRFLLVLLASGALAAANAATISFSPVSQTVNVGDTATVDVEVSGLSAGQAVGAFDLFVDSNSSIITPTSVTFFTNLGPDLSFSGSSLGSSQVEAYEVSNEPDNASLLALQGTQPFSLFALTYTAVGPGTSSLTFDFTPDSAYLADGFGSIITPDLGQGSITVVGKGGGGMSTTPEPSSLVLLGSGGLALLSSLRRRRAA